MWVFLNDDAPHVVLATQNEARHTYGVCTNERVSRIVCFYIGPSVCHSVKLVLPSWILKQCGMETVCQRLFSSNCKTKRRAIIKIFIKIFIHFCLNNCMNIFGHNVIKY